MKLRFLCAFGQRMAEVAAARAAAEAAFNDAGAYPAAARRLAAAEQAAYEVRCRNALLRLGHRGVEPSIRVCSAPRATYALQGHKVRYRTETLACRCTMLVRV